MASMTYCRHENAASELYQVSEMWDDWSRDNSNEYEERARRRLVELIREMHEGFENDGTYETLDAGGTP